MSYILHKIPINGVKCKPLLYLLKFHYCSSVPSVEISADNEDVFFNKVKIPMIHRDLHRQLFNQEKYLNSQKSSDQDNLIIENLKKHGINVTEKIPNCYPHWKLPQLFGEDVEDHFRIIAEQINQPYVTLINKFMNNNIPDMPHVWQFQEGWTRYNRDGSFNQCTVPNDDILVFDTEVVMSEGEAPTLAVALSHEAWYMWCSPRLINPNSSPQATVSLNDLIPIQDPDKPHRERCIIGHFVSFDRARIKEEYDLKMSGSRFVDTMSLHISLSGLTSYQRSLKSSANKGNFDNKLWKEYVERHKKSGGSESEPSYVEMDWIEESGLNSLLDVYKLYCSKTPPQNKDPRKIFEKGTTQDVRDHFQELALYCATDVQMTAEIFRSIWPLFLERSPHPVTLAGLLEMSTMYLPVNSNWLHFQNKVDKAYANLEQSQKIMLMRLANEALDYGKNDRYKSDPWLWDLDWSLPKPPKKKTSDQEPKAPHPELHELPKWYRELVPKPIKDNLDKGAALITTQARITPKLLRLTWEGVPLHFDHSLKWGYLVPGRQASVDQDPRFYNEKGEILSRFEVVQKMLRIEYNLLFPYDSYLKLWVKQFRKKLSESNEALESLPRKDPRDSLLLEELKRSIDIMPLDQDEKLKIRATIKGLKGLGSKYSNERIVKYDALNYKNEMSAESLHDRIPEMQVRGPDFWRDRTRYRSKKLTVETRNPEIPTCWFSYLPHQDGIGKSVGSPLSKSFQQYIKEDILSSEHSEDAKTLLKEYISSSFWRSYSKRIKSQMAVFWDEEIIRKNLNLPADLELSSLPHCQYGAILPQVIMAGTITRRAVERLWLTATNAEKDRLGTEVKAMVQPPLGYCLVGADVDSQEMWIASLLGDANVGEHGGTPYGWMTLEGSKSEGTDLHSKISQTIGITRHQAKILNYARLYGSGLEHSKQLLLKFNPGMQQDEAKQKSSKLLQTTKGWRRRPSTGETEIAYHMRKWTGGSESETFNKLEEIARSPQPETPVLKCKLSRALNPSLVKDDFLTSRTNWVVQSSAVDYLHCMLVCMRWLVTTYNITARLCISIHDEVRFVVKQEDKYRAALALQITNLLTRAMFASKLNLHDLPQSVAFFSSVDIDLALRKEPSDQCITPSNKEGLHHNYNIPTGESLDIAKILSITKGYLTKQEESL